MENPQVVLPIVIDASVMFAGAAARQAGHRESFSFLIAAHALAKSGHIAIHEPVIFLLEMFAISQRRRSQRDFNLYGFMPQGHGLKMKTHAVTESDVTTIISDHLKTPGLDIPHVKAGDLIYLALARRENAVLVTNDNGLLKYDGAFAKVTKPETFMARFIVPKLAK